VKKRQRDAEPIFRPEEERDAPELIRRQEKAIRENLRFMRKRLKLRHAQLAKLSEVPEAKICRWERGKQHLNAEEIGKIGAALYKEVADRLGTTVEALYAESIQRWEAPGPHVEVTRETFRKLREEYVITQTEVAEKWGEHGQTFVSGYESGHMDLSPEELKSLHKALWTLIDQKKKFDDYMSKMTAFVFSNYPCANRVGRH
jgi:transcriptional regulator with XRE-family HTH domain